MAKLSKELLRRAMAAMGSMGGKATAKNMTAAQRRARAKKASLVAAKVRSAKAKR